MEHAKFPPGFDPQPVLEGRLVRLRPLREDDFEALYACAADPLIWEQHPHRDRYRRDVFRAYFDAAMASGGAFAVLDVADGNLIGSSRFYDAAGVRVVVGYTFLRRSHWGGRYNGEMKALMLAHAFGVFGEVWFEIGAANLRSRRAIERIGARLIESREYNGVPYVIYGIRREDFRAAGR